MPKADDRLEALLHQAAAYAEPLAEGQAEAWGQGALERFRQEDLGLAHPPPRAWWQQPLVLLFHGAWVAALLFLFPELLSSWQAFDRSLDAVDLSPYLANPWLVAAAAMALAVLLTPPLRRRLWQELG